MVLAGARRCRLLRPSPRREPDGDAAAMVRSECGDCSKPDTACDVPTVGVGGALARVHGDAPARCRDSLRPGVRLLPVPYRAPATPRTAGWVRYAGRARGTPPLSRYIRVALARRLRRRVDRPGVVHELLPAVLFHPGGVLGVLVHRLARHPTAGGYRPFVRGCDGRPPAAA